MNPIKFNVDHQILAVALRLVEGWDFSLTKQKLLERDYAGWTIERAEQAERGYKRYLALTKASGGQQPVPNGDIDRFWHEHILDTRRYARDCDALFGAFLHHYPYFGMRGEVDAGNWRAVAKASNRVWLELFGEALYGTVMVLDAQKCPQSCPGVKAFDLADAQKCPQSCPGVEAFDLADAQKCPQSCPGVEAFILPQFSSLSEASA